MLLGLSELYLPFWQVYSGDNDNARLTGLISLKGRNIMKMPNEKIDTIMFASCGMNCFVCYKHCYHKRPCAGCLNGDMGKPEHCRKCFTKLVDCLEKCLIYGHIRRVAD